MKVYAIRVVKPDGTHYFLDRSEGMWVPVLNTTCFFNDEIDAYDRLEQEIDPEAPTEMDWAKVVSLDVSNIVELDN